MIVPPDLSDDEAQLYVRRLARWEAKRRRLLEQSLSSPTLDDPDLAWELEEAERILLDYPPLIQRTLDDGRVVFTPKRKGLLSEEGQPELPDVPDWREGFAVIDPSRWPDLIDDPDAVNLRLFSNKFQLDQDGVGSCASEGAAGGWETCNLKQSQELVMLNPWYMYHTTSGGSDSGSTLSGNLSHLMKYGCASQAVWPRSKGWRARPSQAANQDARKHRLLEYFRVRSWEEFGSALLLGFCVYFGYSGHAIFAVNLLNTQRFEYKNSWGRWGDQGHGTVSKSSIVWSYGCYAFTSVVRKD